MAKTKVKRKVAAKETERVKTWRVLRDGLRQGYSVRNAGDFLPEAPSLPTLGVLLRTNVIEEVWVDQEEFDEWEEDQAERDEALAAGIVDEDDEDEFESRPAPRKKVKRTVAKKSVKKSVKKGKSSGNKVKVKGKRLVSERV